jgi:hypothetical protein
MATTYTLIKGETLASSAASYTFSAIPSTYTDLVLKLSLRCDPGYSADVVPFGVRFNSDSATNYSNTALIGYSSGTLSQRDSNANNGTVYYSMNGTNTTANTFGSIDIYVPSYTASQNKPFSTFGAQENNNTTAYIATHAELWRNTAAITSITLTPNSGNFLTESSFYLYGIKNS